MSSCAWPLIGLTLVVLGLVAQRLNARARRGASVAAVWAALAVVAAVPFVAPATSQLSHVLLTGFCIIWAVKLWESAHDRIRDPQMAKRWGHFVFWYLVPPDSQPGHSREQRRVHRRRGRRRLLRAVFKAPMALMLLWLNHWAPELHDSFVLDVVWCLASSYLCLSGLADVVTGSAMQLGHGVDEVFDCPPLSRSPRDFWGQRWNLFVTTFAYRNIFLPCGGIRSPLRSIFFVFFFSGLMHEYLVWALVGSVPQHLGWMQLFFCLHAVVVAGQMAWQRGWGRRGLRLPTWVAIVLHSLWFASTSPLFFAPMDEALHFRSWAVDLSPASASGPALRP